MSAACCQAVAKGVSEAELNRAKRATVTAVLSNLESRAIVAEDIGRQILTYGDRCAPASNFLSAALLCSCHHAFVEDPVKAVRRSPGEDTGALQKFAGYDALGKRWMHTK